MNLNVERSFQFLLLRAPRPMSHPFVVPAHHSQSGIKSREQRSRVHCILRLSAGWMGLKSSVYLPSLGGKRQGRCKIYSLPTQRLNWSWITRVYFSQGILTNGYLQGPALFSPCCPPGLISCYPLLTHLFWPHWSPSAKLTLFAHAVPLSSMARLNLRLHSDVSPSEGETPESNDLLLYFFKAHCCSFRAPPTSCNFTCVLT